MCSAEQSQMPFHQNTALLHSIQSSILPGAATCLQGGSLPSQPCSHAPLPAPPGVHPSAHVPALHTLEHPLLSISFTFPPAHSQNLTQSHAGRGEQGRVFKDAVPTTEHRGLVEQSSCQQWMVCGPEEPRGQGMQENKKIFK